MLFSYLLHYVLVTCNEIISFPMYGTVFAFFASINKNDFLCVMTKKMVWNERMSPFKHVHIIQGKI